MPFRHYMMGNISHAWPCQGKLQKHAASGRFRPRLYLLGDDCDMSNTLIFMTRYIISSHRELFRPLFIDYDAFIILYSQVDDILLIEYLALYSTKAYVPPRHARKYILLFTIILPEK